MTTGILLEAPGLDPLDVSRANGYIVTRLDLGDADTRAVATEAPDADGTDDTTSLTGARVVTMAVRLVPRNGYVPDVLERRLRAFTAPRLRPTMTIARDGMPTVQATLRRGPFSAPIEQATYRDITVQWVAPSGILESADEHVRIVYAAGTGATVGRAYSLTFSRVYPASPPLGTGIVVNAGNTDAYPLIRLYGPVTEPEIDNLTQGKSLVFAGLTLTAAEYLEIDTRAKTILLNGDSASSRYDKLDFPGSDWWTLSPGENEIWFHPATFTEATSLAELTWRDAYL